MSHAGTRILPCPEYVRGSGSVQVERRSEVYVREMSEPGRRRRVPWFVSFLGRRLVWALITLLIFLTAVF